ncbi:hypothetical protein M409DRAFT_68410 [Zasmidium cellare ATCC 36951]|uniref:Xylanolytic transcriptional activator regulatory domain-containing protein n=1 Tax=Zasmidium cellare ATCC 36951 TaxID=1080233 RepID=A0A6A6C8J4_ZASCE|nr:uncharacterized protein M409DRAFT_68410 [Zasmidium cellare ATCC 36951]KAF2163464.1 hypothetical protein M409DRAFT_68410 [Zasmidium cellare ATCC 36951]
MAPSSAQPSGLHRAPIACVKRRAAKVRCIQSRDTERCDRCIDQGIECAFQTPTRTKHRSRPARSTFSSAAGVRRQHQHQGRQTAHDNRLEGFASAPISDEVRARIVAALTALKGQRGSPFNFVTSGDTPSLTGDERQQGQPQTVSATTQVGEASLKLSSILRPLETSIPRQDPSSDQAVCMPSYVSSMTLGHTILDPIAGGILTLAISKALYAFFLLDMNAKWEYILDPSTDSHDSVRKRSSLLFTTILFCASKFAQVRHNHVVNTPDVFLQSRLCSLSRNLAIRAMAEGSRAIETMQAFYLLACWKEPEDDISYLHCGYAFRVLQDLDLQGKGTDESYLARRRRTWLGLYRQDKQQNLFFVRRASLTSGDEDGVSFVGDWHSWSRMPHAIPLDFMSCCNAELRRLQARLLVLVRKASPQMLSCLGDLLESELARWKLECIAFLEQSPGELPSPSSRDGNVELEPGLMDPGTKHFDLLRSLWESSVRLNIASAILRQALGAAVAKSSTGSHSGLTKETTSASTLATSLSLDTTSMSELLSTDFIGLRGSIEGALGTLRQLLCFPTDDLRRAPDSVVLLGPHAALFLCLLLCLPCKGLLGQSFQQTAIKLVFDIARHFEQAVQSPQDTMALHLAYLESLTSILTPASSGAVSLRARQNIIEEETTGPLTASGGAGPVNEEPMPMPDQFAAESAARVLASGFGSIDDGVGVGMEGNNHGMGDDFSDFGQQLNIQSLANLLDPGYFTGFNTTGTDTALDTWL